jgi:hypothetical protein
MSTKYDDNNNEASVKCNKAMNITYDTLWNCTSLHDAVHRGNPTAQHEQNHKGKSAHYFVMQWITY